MKIAFPAVSAQEIVALKHAIVDGGSSFEAVAKAFGTARSADEQVRALVAAHKGGAIFVGDLPMAGESALAGAARAQGMAHLPVFDGTVATGHARIAAAAASNQARDAAAIPGAQRLMKRGAAEPFTTMSDSGTITLNGKSFEYTPGDVRMGDRIIDRQIFNDTYAVETRAGEQVAFKTSPTLLVEMPGNFALLDDESVAALKLTSGRPGDVIAEGVEHGERWRITHDVAHAKYPDLPGN